MDEITSLHDGIRKFEVIINADKALSVHKENKFNKQFSVLLKDWHYLKVIWDRIEKADPDKDITQLGLDLKSMYVFGRVFSESLLYITSLFIPTTPKVDWTKIGVFVKTTLENLENQPDDFKKFWTSCGETVIHLHETFKYRNNVLHEKDSNTEWTMAWPGRSNLDHVSISNVPWSEDKGKKKEIKSLNTRELVKILETDSNSLISYLMEAIKNNHV
jgi:hypothetical protein